MSTNYIVTQCPIHGTTETSDRASFVAYVEVALACQIGHMLQDDYEHDFHHVVMQEECWYCCDEQTIDPANILPVA